MNSIFQFPSSTNVLHITKNIPLCFPDKTRSFGVTFIQYYDFIKYKLLRVVAVVASITLRYIFISSHSELFGSVFSGIHLSVLCSKAENYEPE